MHGARSRDASAPEDRAQACNRGRTLKPPRGLDDCLRFRGFSPANPSRPKPRRHDLLFERFSATLPHAGHYILRILNPAKDHLNIHLGFARLTGALTIDPVLANETYRQYYDLQNFNVAAAYASFILLLSMITSLFYLRAVRTQEEVAT